MRVKHQDQGPTGWGKGRWAETYLEAARAPPRGPESLNDRTVGVNIAPHRRVVRRQRQSRSVWRKAKALPLPPPLLPHERAKDAGRCGVC